MVITVPTLLLLCSIGKYHATAAVPFFSSYSHVPLAGVNAYTIFWFSHPSQANGRIALALLSAVYPLAFLQNVMTTGLITLKIWNQHRASTATGVVDRSSKLSLSRIMRIIIESAMVYTVQLFILIILFFLQDNFQIIVQSAVVPSVGTSWQITCRDQSLIFCRRFGLRPHCRSRAECKNTDNYQS